jgi:hypothetical protein
LPANLKDFEQMRIVLRLFLSLLAPRAAALGVMAEVSPENAVSNLNGWLTRDWHSIPAPVLFVVAATAAIALVTSFAPVSM